MSTVRQRTGLASTQDEYNEVSEGKTGKPEKKNPYLYKNSPLIFMLMVVLSTSFMYFTGKAVHDGGLKLTPKSIGPLKSYTSKLEFTLKYQVPGVAWLVFCIFYVIKFRVTTKAFNPLGGAEQYTEMAKNILQNSIEQYLLSFLAQLILLSFIDGPTTLKVIPLLSLFFLVGRVTFWLGYPAYRSFGFLTTLLPTQITIGYTIYKFYLMYQA